MSMRLTKLLGWACLIAALLSLVWLACALMDAVSNYRGPNEKIKYLP
jgi:hypothetical protein